MTLECKQIVRATTASVSTHAASDFLDRVLNIIESYVSGNDPEKAELTPESYYNQIG